MAHRKRPKIVLIDQTEEPQLEEERVEQEEPPEEIPVTSSSRRKKVKTRTLEGAEPDPEQAPKPRNTPRRKRRALLVSSIIFGIMAFTVLVAFIFIPLDERQVKQSALENRPANCLKIFPEFDWELALHELECSTGYWEDHKTLSDWLLDQGVGYKSIIALTDQLQGEEIEIIRPGQPYTLLHGGNIREPAILAYQTAAAEYILLKITGDPAVHRHPLQLLDQEEIVENVVIEGGLAEVMFNREFGLKLSGQMEEALKWDVDFFHLDPGDQFKLLYTIDQFEGDRRDLGRLSAVRYQMNGRVSHAFYFDHEYIKGYFDEDGRPMKSGFLKAPLKFGRISSPFNLNRNDPFTGEKRAHLGTDYAAPVGTEIHAVANGVVTHAEFKGNNGNYVKILHSEEIQTQYLHMRNFAPGIEPGAKVSQGQVIGYVGMTGRTTGPHVCFRFWKNGEQADHRKQIGFGTRPPLRGDILEEFLLHRDSLWNQLEPI